MFRLVATALILAACRTGTGGKDEVADTGGLSELDADNDGYGVRDDCDGCDDVWMWIR